MPRVRKNQQTSTPSEAALHASVAEFLNWMLLPPAVWTTFPAGWGKLGKATAGYLKKSGLKAGLPDCLVFHNDTCIGIELKTEKGKLSAAQKAMFPLLEAAGIKIFVCRSMIEVDDVLRNCLVPMRSHQWQDRRGLKSTPLAVT